MIEKTVSHDRILEKLDGGKRLLDEVQSLKPHRHALLN